jgi:hypothetical protein
MRRRNKIVKKERRFELSGKYDGGNYAKEIEKAEKILDNEELLEPKIA